MDRRRTLGAPPAEAVEEASDEPGPDARAEESWTAWRIHRALAELPEQERRLIELAYWGGLSQSEIAEFLDIPLGTVNTRTRSALSRLADADFVTGTSIVVDGGRLVQSGRLSGA